MQIRLASLDDLGPLLGLYRHLNPDPDPDPAAATEALRRFLALPDCAILLGHVGPVPVASVTLVIVPNLTRGARPWALVENVVTHADHRQQGHGTRLLDEASRIARDKGCYKLMLLTGSSDPATLGFYRSAGFAQTKTGFQKRFP